jgi:hypothetical protein
MQETSTDPPAWLSPGWWTGVISIEAAPETVATACSPVRFDAVSRDTEFRQFAADHVTANANLYPPGEGRLGISRLPR